jgi:hypothetical protein
MQMACRVRFAWELTWPMALIDVAVIIVLHGVLNVAGESADSLWAVVALFGVSPWVVRRALNLRYGALGIRPKLTYQHSLKVMWLLAWRTLALSLAALIPISLALRALHFNVNFGDQNPLMNNLGLSAVDAVSTLVFTPLLVGPMLRKRYRGFHFELIEEKPAKALFVARKKGRT